MVAANHIVGTAVTVISAILLSKILGPKLYAIYAICTSLSGALRPICRLGVNACLLTQKEQPGDHDYQTALSTMLLCSMVVVTTATALIPWLGCFTTITEISWPAAVAIALLPLHVLSLPALTRLERNLQFKPVVMIELAGQVLGQSVGISLAFCGWGVWGPLTGWGIRAVFQAVSPWVVIGRLPRLSWDGKNALRMIRFGFGYVVASTFAQSRNLLFLSVVGRILGQESVGHIGLTLRAAGLIAPFRAAAARVALPALSPIARIPDALRKGLVSVVETELLLSAPVTIVAVSLYPVCIHLLLGPAWQQSIPLFPWIAAGSLLVSAHTTSLGALHIRGYFFESIVSTGICNLALMVCSARLGNLMGVEGCAAAAVVTWPMCWIQEWFAHQRLGTRGAVNGIAWAVGGAAACLSWRLGPWLLAVPAVIVVVTRVAIHSRFKQILSAIN